MSANAIDVWIDTDAAIGISNADVDDGLALIQAFHSPELHVRGVSSVFGNAPIDQTHGVASEVVDRFGPPGLEVQKGAGGPSDLGVECSAASALADALDRSPLHILALGPVTNVASLLRRQPNLEERILSIVMVAARRPGQSFISQVNQITPFPDLNFDCDPKAMQVILDCAAPLVFAPWEVSSHVWIQPEDLDRIEAASEAGHYIAQHARPWLENWRQNLGASGFNPFDTLAVAALSHPELLESFSARVWIDEGPNDTALPDDPDAAPSKPHLLVAPDPVAGDRAATYCHRPRSAFHPLLLERLIAKPEL